MLWHRACIADFQDRSAKPSTLEGRHSVKNLNRFIKGISENWAILSFSLVLMGIPDKAMAAREAFIIPLVSETLGMAFLGTGLVLVGIFGRKKRGNRRL